ncbi:MAG: hypothetical protein MUE82_02265 [Chloroflexi bacterium]|jgi:hypothetical protein|nr:hypothetical protein [Chloroflexota bacterium]
MTLQRPRSLAGRRELRFLVAGFASAALLVAMVAPAMAAQPVRAAAAPLAGVKTAQVKITKINAGAKFAPVGTIKVGPKATDEFRKSKPKKGIQPKKGYYGPANAQLAMPSTPSLPVVTSSPLSGRSGAVGRDGMSGTEMRYASPDGYRWNYSLEPPDMALCVGGGYVVQAINGAVQIFSTSGAALTGVTPANYFIGWPPEYPSGPGVGDPRCQYDPQTKRFFMTWYIYGGMNVLFGTILAVSNSSNPLGTWSVYELPDVGGMVLPDCVYACFPDYPQLGIDGNGVWIANNEFDFGNPYGANFAGVTLWGVSKRAVIDSRGAYLQADVWGLGFDGPEPLAFTVMPAVTPSGGYDTSSGGTQYFMSTRDMYGTRDNIVDVWAITGTNQLNLTTNVFPSLTRVQLAGQTYACDCIYGAPAGGAKQKYGPHPLGEGLIDPSISNQPMARLDTNDDRMHQVVYSAGMLWGAAGTVMDVAGNTAGPTVGVAWWTVRVGTLGGGLLASIAGQGYIGVKDSYLWFPAVAVSSTVRGVVAMSFSSPTRWPSVAYAQFDPFMGASTVRVAANGTAAADGFTAYPPYSRNGTERWGDYNAAATDEAGNVWFAAEYIGKDSTLPSRAAFLNWGTYIGVTYPQ